jgi:hypothetical protein
MLSKLKKKLKSGLPGSERKPGRAGAGTGGERADATGSLPRPVPHVVRGGSHSDSETAVGSGLRREGNDAGEEDVERLYPSSSTPSLVRGGKPDGM